jgi:translation initiation factor IF-3
MFRGREMAHTDLGRKILDRLVEDLGDTAVVEAQPKQDGRNMVMVIGPTKKAAELKAESLKSGAGRGPASSPEPAPIPGPAPSSEPAEEPSAHAVEEPATAEEQPQPPGSVEGPQPATR